MNTDEEPAPVTTPTVVNLTIPGGAMTLGSPQIVVQSAPRALPPGMENASAAKIIEYMRVQALTDAIQGINAAIQAQGATAEGINAAIQTQRAISEYLMNPAAQPATMNEERHNPRPQQHPQDPFDLLTDDGMMFPIFEFIGTGHFCFVAGVSRRWRRLYTQFQQKEYRKRVQNEEEFEKMISTLLTTTASIAESLSRAKVFLDDTTKLTSPFKPLIMQKKGSQELKELDTPQPAVSFLRDEVAVRYGHVDILELAIANGCTCDQSTCSIAAMYGHLDVLQWLRTNGCPWDELTCTCAAEGGHLEVLRWARENCCPWDDETCKISALNGHLDVLQWANQHGCPWDECTCANAALNGHLDVLQWARASGCPWDEWTCANAAYGGHLDVLQWARQNSCPWDNETCASAAEDGHLEVLQWLRTNGCPWDESTSVRAAEGFHLEVLRWAIGNGCEWNPHLFENRFLQNVMDWLQENELIDA